MKKKNCEKMFKLFILLPIMTVSYSLTVFFGVVNLICVYLLYNLVWFLLMYLTQAYASVRLFCLLHLVVIML